jgi:hypothetical protein
MAVIALFGEQRAARTVDRDVQDGVHLGFIAKKGGGRPVGRASGSFFEKKQPKKLLFALGHAGWTAIAQRTKGFLRSFFFKKAAACFP